MIVDDARMVDPKSCQLEAWTRKNPGLREYWAMPACNFTGNLELGFGGARLRPDAGPGASGAQVQAKTILDPLEANGWGFALAAGAQRHPRERTPGSETDPYGYVAASRSLWDDKAFVHFNAGVAREREYSRSRLTGGAGMEYALTGRFGLMGEAFKQSAGRPQYQLGMRYWIVPERVQVDTTLGHRFGNAEGARWVSVGIRLLSPAFLP